LDEGLSSCSFSEVSPAEGGKKALTSKSMLLLLSRKRKGLKSALMREGRYPVLRAELDTGVRRYDAGTKAIHLCFHGFQVRIFLFIGHRTIKNYHP
jgi:hypothetical protein